MNAIAFLHADDPPDRFPDPAGAATEPDGLLAIGGDLAPERLIAAYRRGIFPWYEEGQPILWWSPDPRAVLLPGALHVSRSLRRTLRSDRYRVSVDLAFGPVIDACARTRRATGTWITPAMRSAYLRLHELGHAHAIEAWLGPDLVGGLYGVALGGVFFGESMFSLEADASKVALVHLVSLAEKRGLKLIDCQVATGHLASLGSQLMPREDFLRAIRVLTGIPAPPGPWTESPGPTSVLAAPRPGAGRLHG
ncbi:MAG: leucyl/phenylalanyl-tRNA--protein transferase [Chromatiales bacterium]|nr:leucyl/phenylalanyl-tRNA--protein transferase [Chromatiales bacterium]